MRSQVNWRSTRRSAAGWRAAWRPGAVAGLCALLALSLHGAIALAEQHDPGLERPSALCYFLAVVFLQPDLQAGAPPDLTVVGWLAEEPIPSAASALLALLPSRGPPA